MLNVMMGSYNIIISSEWTKGDHKAMERYILYVFIYLANILVLNRRMRGIKKKPYGIFR